MISHNKLRLKIVDLTVHVFQSPGRGNSLVHTHISYGLAGITQRNRIKMTEEAEKRPKLMVNDKILR